MLACVIAVLCLSLELEFLEQLDSLSLYMTDREIAKDAGAALWVSIGLAVTWWLFTWLVVQVTSIVPGARHSRTSLLWRLGLAIPLSYLALDLFAALQLEVFPRFHPGLLGWVGLAGGFVAVGVFSLCTVRISSLQQFCRTRLAPVGWFHVALAAVAALVLWAQGVHPFHDYVNPVSGVVASDKPDIYLITIDALRAQDMSVYGYSRPTTPNLEKFADHAFIFDSFYSNSNFTPPCTTSIETGKLPWSHRIFHIGAFLHGRQSQKNNLAELLRNDGYYTANISSNYMASPILHKTAHSYDAEAYAAPHNITGWWQRYSDFVGLNTFHTLAGAMLARVGALRIYLDAVLWSKSYPYPPEPVFAWARALLQRTDITQPRFVWTHILPPHDPYLPPLPYRTSFLPGNKLSHSYEFLSLRHETIPAGASVSDLRARYDENVAYADHVVGNYLDWLDRTGKLDRAIVIVSADHGESFEHNWYTHAGEHLYDGLIHIPLLIHLPGQQHSEHIATLAEQADLLPTILDLIGQPPPSWTDGTSLKPALDGKAMRSRFIFTMNLERDRVFSPISKGTIAVMDEHFKYVDYLDPHHEYLYQYRADPGEEHDLIATEPDVARRMRDLLTEKVAEVNRPFARNP
jgi:arylsulfatase A-like enzyme